MRYALILLLFLTDSAPAADPFTFSAPKGWRSERIPFPLGFAPELKYKGFEELRFGPGMFQPASDTYWTYVFFWWIEGDIKLSQEQLEKDLNNYYRGLSQAVGARKFQIDADRVSAQLTAIARKRPDDPVYSASLKTYDAFATGKLLDLNVEISRRHYPKLNRTCYFFAVSPKDGTDPIWKQMRSIGQSFRVRAKK